MIDTNWNDFIKKHACQPFHIIGKGPGFDPKEQFDGPVIAINETYQHLIRVDYVISYNQSTWDYILSNYRPGPKYLAPRQLEDRIRNGARNTNFPTKDVILFRKGENESELLTYDREMIARRRALFAHVGTVTSAVVWAWFCGAQQVHFHGFGGDGYSPLFPGQPDSLFRYAKIWQATLDICEILGVEPNLHVPPVEDPKP